MPEKFKKRRKSKARPTVASRRQVALAEVTRRWLAAAVIAGCCLAVVLFFTSTAVTSKASPRPIRPAAPATPTIPEKSIAVLPFENLSGEKANAYFADGIQDEILTRLSKIADLKVISRTSTQHYKSAPENLPEIAQQLGVANIRRRKRAKERRRRAGERAADQSGQ